MAFTSRLNSSRRRGWLTSLMCAVLLLGVVGAAVGDLPKDRPNSRRSGRGLGLAAHIFARHIIDRNRVILLLTDVGELGSSGSSVAGGGFWITTTDQYIFSAGPNIGATAPSTTPGKRDTLVFIGGPFSEVAFGSLTFTDKLPNASAAGGGADAGVFWDSTDPEDAANFPAPCTVDATRLADFPALSPFEGEPFPGFADQTVCWATNDVTGGTCGDCGGKRLGAEIITTAFVFGVPLVQDFVFVAFRIFNRTDFLNATTAPIQPPGPYDLTNVTVAVAADMDIGDAGDDQFAFLPDVQTMVYWDSDFFEPQFQNPLGFGGITYLKTPDDPITGEEVGLAEFTVFTNGGARPDPSDKEEWYKLMTGDVTEVVFEVTPQDVRGMASSGLFTLPQDEFVEIYAAFFFATVSGAPPAQLLAEGYKSLTTGEIDPTANTHPAFDNFKLVQQTAQATFDAGFVVPTAPPKPDFELIPGDHQVTIVFDANSVTAVNPFAKVARDPFARLGTGQPDPEAPGTGVFIESGTVVFIPARDQGGTTGFITADEAGLVDQEVTNPAFNPAFVIQDFQGFRIYRSRGGSSTDAELIAQFDVADAITGGFFCIEAIGVFDELGNLIQAVCQEVEERTLGTNTGLSFAVIDRGGSFPNPADGPGLINGIPVFYTVTSYAVNCGQTPGVPADIAGAVLPPAGCLVLEGGLAPFKEATPRSNSSAFAAGAALFTPLKADGSDCNSSEAAATVDATTGHYTDFIECSNAIYDVGLVPARDVNIPSGDFFLVIDKILPSATNPYAGGYTLAFGFNEVFFHWEDEDGNPAPIQPQSGSFEQTYDFFHAAETKIFFGLDTDPSDTGVDLGMNLTIASDFSAAEDLEVDGKSLHLGELGGVHVGETRPHRITGSSLAAMVNIGNVRGLTNSREYTGAGPYSQAATSYELTWEVTGNTYSGTLRSKGINAEVPKGGQPVGPDNPSAPADFISGYNWGFITDPVPATVRARIFPAAGPLTNTMTLAVGQTFAILVPGQSVYIEGITTLPQNGEKWTFLIDSGSQRSGFGRDGTPNDAPTAPFRYRDTNDGGGTAFSRALTNVFPGARWKLSLSGGSNELVDADLGQVRVVPNPFVAANEITRGIGLQRILFTNLPPQATVRIYTINGNLVRILEHGDGDGTLEWDVRTRFDLLVASGNYYFHVTTPDGRTHLGRFAVVN